MILAAEEDHQRPMTRLGLRMPVLTADRPSEFPGAAWAEFEGLDGKAPALAHPALGSVVGDLAFNKAQRR